MGPRFVKPEIMNINPFGRKEEDIEEEEYFEEDNSSYLSNNESSFGFGAYDEEPQEEYQYDQDIWESYNKDSPVGELDIPPFNDNFEY